MEIIFSILFFLVIFTPVEDIIAKIFSNGKLHFYCSNKKVIPFLKTKKGIGIKN